MSRKGQGKALNGGAFFCLWKKKLDKLLNGDYLRIRNRYTQNATRSANMDDRLSDRRLTVDLYDDCIMLKWADTGRSIGPYISDLSSIHEVLDALRGTRRRATNGRSKSTISVQGGRLGVDVGNPVAGWHSRLRLTWEQAERLADDIERIVILASTDKVTDDLDG